MKTMVNFADFFRSNQPKAQAVQQLARHRLDAPLV